MFDLFMNIIIILYALSILFVLLHSLFDAHLIYHYLRHSGTVKNIPYNNSFIPFVTIQLPVYNELHVVERLLDAVSAIEYPADKMEIQVLDDSTDETSEIIVRKISLLQQRNISIHHIQRQHRDGFKAGALKHALDMAKGEFLAIFDADFIPAKDFLRQTIPFFDDPSMGMVQTKWEHLNKNTSLLATLQAMALDGHFSIEQQGRNAAGYFINFNGTAGVWRKKAILDAGNWQADTLTEDFDLSYRAQMKGWRFKYLEKYTTPAELPPLLSALKAQQFRWTKGGVETARKNIQSFLSSPLSLPVKLHGVFHLIYSFGFISIFTYALLTVPLLFVKENFPQYNFVFAISRLIGISFFIYMLHYFIAYFKNAPGNRMQRLLKFIIYFPLFVSLFIGLSLSNTVAIVQGYLGIKSGFVRTPKFNTNLGGIKAIKSGYAEIKFSWLNIMEGLLIVYYLFGLIEAFAFKNYGSIPLLLMAFIGFSMIFWLSITERVQKLIVSHD